MASAASAAWCLFLLPVDVPLDANVPRDLRGAIVQRHASGEVVLGPRGSEVFHEFHFTNTSDGEVCVVRVSRTCGCLSTTIEPDCIKAGETCRVGLSMSVGRAGPNSQSVILELSDGSLREFELTAVGLVHRHFVMLAPSGLIEPGRRTVDIRLYYVDTQRVGERIAPVFDLPSGATIEFNGWTDLTESPPRSDRPTRQVGTATLTLPDQLAQDPFVIRARLSQGATASIEFTVMGERSRSIADG